MRIGGTLLATLLLVNVGSLHGNNVAGRGSAKVDTVEARPSPEMQRLLDVFQGDWTVNEAFEISGSKQGKSRQGVASFRPGAGFSLIEDYKSNGSAGPLYFLAVIWWDSSAKVYRLLTCANNDGCQLRGTLKWEGGTLVNSWQEEVNGKTTTFKDAFVDISSSGLRLDSVGTSDGKIIWHVITNYRRVADNKK